MRSPDGTAVLMPAIWLTIRAAASEVATTRVSVVVAVTTAMELDAIAELD